MVLYSKLEDFGFTVTQNQPPVQCSAGNDFDVLLAFLSYSVDGGGSKGLEDLGGLQSSGVTAAAASNE